MTDWERHLWSLHKTLQNQKVCNTVIAAPGEAVFRLRVVRLLQCTISHSPEGGEQWCARFSPDRVQNGGWNRWHQVWRQVYWPASRQATSKETNRSKPSKLVFRDKTCLNSCRNFASYFIHLSPCYGNRLGGWTPGNGHLLHVTEVSPPFFWTSLNGQVLAEPVNCICSHNQQTE